MATDETVDAANDDEDEIIDGHEVLADGDPVEVKFYLDGVEVTREDYLAARVGQAADALDALAALAFRGFEEAQESAPPAPPPDASSMFGLGDKKA